MNQRGQRRPIQQFNLLGKFIKEFPSVCDAGRATGIHYNSINQNARGKSKMAGTYIWKYKPVDEDLSGEWWKHHPEWPIFCSSEGRIRRETSRQPYALKGRDVGGYRRLNLRIDGKVKTRSVARLIGETFWPWQKIRVQKESDQPVQIDHINRIRDDDRACNLQWVTPGQNLLNRDLNKLT